jgi:glycosyltransferase involved in cell wall biosynthesis
MTATAAKPARVYLDLTHLGRHVTGLERVSIEQFEKIAFEGAEVRAVRSAGQYSMIFKQQVVLPLLALLHPSARFVFPGFPPSPIFALMRDRVVLYVHDTFLITRPRDLSLKARLYMAPCFKVAVRRLKHFLVNSEKTRGDLMEFAPADAKIGLYRPAVGNVFQLTPDQRLNHADQTSPLRLVSLGTIEPRKNYLAAVAILDALRASCDPGCELHIIGREGWGDAGQRIKNHPGVTVHGYLDAGAARKIMDEADIYLCTSHDEGLGLPLLEAQFAGLAVVAPSQPVFREVLGRSAMFIDPSDAAAAVAAIVALLAKPGWRREAASASTANVERWNGLAATDLNIARKMFAADAGNSPAKGAEASNVPQQ